MSKLGTLYFLIGKMGAGKSTFSRKISAELGAVLISEDDWLNTLYPGEINNFDDFLVRHRKLLNLLQTHVEQILTSGSSVIMDFPANTIDSRQWYVNLAKNASAAHQAIYLKASDEKCLMQIANRRIEQPDRAKFDTPETFAMVNQYFEEPLESEHLILLVIEQ